MLQETGSSYKIFVPGDWVYYMIKTFRVVEVKWNSLIDGCITRIYKSIAVMR